MISYLKKLKGKVKNTPHFFPTRGRRKLLISHFFSHLCYIYFSFFFHTHAVII